MTFNQFTDTIEQTFAPLSDLQTSRFGQLEGLYADWNSKINVISRKDMDEFYSHHVLHSLAVAAYMKSALPNDYLLARGLSPLPGNGYPDGVLPPSGNEYPDGVFPLSGNADSEVATGKEVAGKDAAGKRLKILDLGTGGGFPGIPLAILMPEADFLLCDSIGKKIKVVDDIASQLGLENVRTANARAESLDGQFDYIVSRAVTSLDNFLPWVRKKYRKGILYLKGGDIAEEIATAMGKFNLRKGSVHTWTVDSWLKDSYFSGKYVVFIENFCK